MHSAVVRVRFSTNLVVCFTCVDDKLSQILHPVTLPCSFRHIKKSNKERMHKNCIIIYLQSESIEKYQLELCSKYDKEYDFDIILG